MFEPYYDSMKKMEIKQQWDNEIYTQIPKVEPEVICCRPLTQEERQTVENLSTERGYRRFIAYFKTA